MGENIIDSEKINQGVSIAGYAFLDNRCIAFGDSKAFCYRRGRIMADPHRTSTRKIFHAGKFLCAITGVSEVMLGSRRSESMYVEDYVEERIGTAQSVREIVEDLLKLIHENSLWNCVLDHFPIEISGVHQEGELWIYELYQIRSITFDYHFHQILGDHECPEVMIHGNQRMAEEAKIRLKAKGYLNADIIKEEIEGMLKESVDEGVCDAAGGPIEIVTYHANIEE